VQPFDPDEGRSLAGSCSALGHRPLFVCQTCGKRGADVRGAIRACQNGHGLMKYAADRPYSDPEKAARKLVEIANSVEALISLSL
jgi:hypothetical protein